MKQEEATRVLNSFEVYLKSNRVMLDTISTYMPVAKKFLEAASELSEAEFRAYQANNYGVKNNTALRNHYALMSLFKSQNVTVNIEPPPQEDHPNQPTINKDDMGRLILAIRAGGNSTERGLLALSSVYGLRRKELRLSTRADLDFENKAITIRAAKHGRERKHLIPDCIFDFVSNYDFKLRSNMEYANTFWEIIKKAGLSLTPGHGWHSIRRALYTGFVDNEFDYFLRHEFMRWRIRGMDLDQIYSQFPPAEIDRRAFSKHPFLKHWGG